LFLLQFVEWFAHNSIVGLVKCLETNQKGNNKEKVKKISSSLALLVPVEHDDKIDNSHVPGISRSEAGDIATEDS
jgi:hypothetical protein